MAELGADPIQLRELSAEFRRTAQLLTRSHRSVRARLRSTHWTGRDAREFRRDWERTGRRFRVTTEDLAEAAAALEHEAAQQERASRAEIRPPPHGDPIPLRSESWELGGEVAAMFGARGTLSATIDDLPGRGSMVWISQEVGGFVTGGVGAEAAMGDGSGVELGADGSLGVATTERRGWYVQDDRALELLRDMAGREMLERTARLTPHPLGPVVDRILPDSIDPVERARHGLVELGGELLGVGGPAPAVVDQLFAVEADGGLAATVLLPVAGVSGAGMQAIGTRERSEGLGILWSAEGRIEGDLGGSGWSGEVRSTVELPHTHDGMQPAIVTTSVTRDGTETIERSVIEIEGSVGRRAVRRAFRSIARGRSAEAVEELGAALATAVNPHAWTDSAVGVIDDDVHSIDLGAAVGPRLSGSIGGGRTVVDYRG